MYKLTDTANIIRTADSAIIPPNPDNTDYRDYLAWLAEGNTPDPADPPPAPDHSALRRAAYAAEADPIYFMSQRGEATQADWLAKVAEIKARYPASP